MYQALRATSETLKRFLDQQAAARGLPSPTVKLATPTDLDQGNTSGVSLLSWGAYFVAACLWLVDGLRKHDKTIWVACIGWVLLDGAVFIGVLLRH